MNPTTIYTLYWHIAAQWWLMWMPNNEKKESQ